MNVVVIDNDEDFVKGMVLYWQGSEYSQTMRLKAFTSEELALEHLKNCTEPMIILVSTNMFPAVLPEFNSKLIFLGSENTTESKRNGSYPEMNKFQPLQQLLSRINAYSINGNDEMRDVESNRTNIISFYSAVGHCGKTTASIHLAKLLSSRGRKVFYLSLETAGTAAILLQGRQNQNFSQLLYFLRTAPNKLMSKLELLKNHDPSSLIHYFVPPDHVSEMNEVTESDVKLMIEKLRQLEIYDDIIIDLEASINNRVTTVLQGSDHVVWFVLDDVQCLHKTVAFKNYYYNLHRIHYVLNKHTGTVCNDFLGSGIPIASYLPYIPQWKNVHQTQQLFTVRLFQDSIYELSKTVLSVNKGVLC